MKSKRRYPADRLQDELRMDRTVKLVLLGIFLAGMMLGALLTFLVMRYAL